MAASPSAVGPWKRGPGPRPSIFPRMTSWRLGLQMRGKSKRISYFLFLIFSIINFSIFPLFSPAGPAALTWVGERGPSSRRPRPSRPPPPIPGQPRLPQSALSRGVAEAVRLNRGVREARLASDPANLPVGDPNRPTGQYPGAVYFKAKEVQAGAVPKSQDR